MRWASNEWKANQPFNVLFENPTPSGVDFIGIVFHKQDAKGKDVEFVNEYQQNIGMENRKYATVGDSLRLPAGVYSVYIIALGQTRIAGTPRESDRVFCEDDVDREVGTFAETF